MCFTVLKWTAINREIETANTVSAMANTLICPASIAFCPDRRCRFLIPFWGKAERLPGRSSGVSRSVRCGGNSAGVPQGAQLPRSVAGVAASVPQARASVFRGTKSHPGRSSLKIHSDSARPRSIHPMTRKGPSDDPEGEQMTQNTRSTEISVALVVCLFLLLTTAGLAQVDDFYEDLSRTDVKSTRDGTEVNGASRRPTTRDETDFLEALQSAVTEARNQLKSRSVDLRGRTFDDPDYQAWPESPRTGTRTLVGSLFREVPGELSFGRSLEHPFRLDPSVVSILKRSREALLRQGSALGGEAQRMVSVYASLLRDAEAIGAEGKTDALMGKWLAEAIREVWVRLILLGRLVETAQQEEQLSAPRTLARIVAQLQRLIGREFGSIGPGGEEPDMGALTAAFRTQEGISATSGQPGSYTLRKDLREQVDSIIWEGRPGLGPSPDLDERHRYLASQIVTSVMGVIVFDREDPVERSQSLKKRLAHVSLGLDGLRYVTVIP